jgi:hypothetical protein
MEYQVPEPKTIADEIGEFIGRYLQCTDHQRNVLVLWLLHAHCFAAADITPYLSIYSNEKQAGKTLCLRLLSLLSPNPALTTGVTAATLSKRTDCSEVPTFLLDEAQVTLGTRARSKNPTLRSLLVSGFERGIGYSESKRERNLFAPKVFAGIGPLPEPLSDRSLPILLDPVLPWGKQPLAADHNSIKVQRFNLARAQEEAKPLMEKIESWAKEHLAALKAAKPYDREQLPITFSPRRQDMIEPLLHLADALGGAWPQRARKSLTGIFDYQFEREHKDKLRLLEDIRAAFIHYGCPDKLSTASILAFLHTLPRRPWNQNGPITAQTLAYMLQIFGIRSRSQRIKKSAAFSNPHRGYRAQDFIVVWAQLLAAETAGGSPNPYPKTVEEAQNWPTQEERDLLAGLEKLVEKDRKANAKLNGTPNEKPSEKPNKDAGCSNVAAAPQNLQVPEFIPKEPAQPDSKFIPSEARTAG